MPTVGRHVQPAPAKKPLACCQVSPRFTSTGDFIVVRESRRRERAVFAEELTFVARVLFVYASPSSSAVNRSDLRDGNPAPTPQRKPLVCSTALGVPRTMKPP